MKNHSGRQSRGRRSRRFGKHAGIRHAPSPDASDSQISAAGSRADDAEPAELRATTARARETRECRPATGETVAAAMQLAIGLLTASQDSLELEAYALPVLIPPDADGLGDLMAGLHLISELVIHELHEATGEPPEAILQRLAILAEYRRGTLSAD